MMTLIIRLMAFVAIAAHAEPEVTVNAINPNCITSTVKTKLVTHYMVPLLDSYNNKICDVIEGTCIYNKNGVQYMHNVGYADVPVAQSKCKNGWGNKHNCLHPCRNLAASMKYHKFGQIVFIKELVGQKCGNKQRDGFEMIHDGYMIVMDTGSPNYFNAPGRFDFFWGRCKNQSSGSCHEGAIPISENITKTDYCTVWDPSKPSVNADFKKAFVKQMQAEDLARDDAGAAADLNSI